MNINLLKKAKRKKLGFFFGRGSKRRNGKSALIMPYPHSNGQWSELFFELDTPKERAYAKDKIKSLLKTLNDGGYFSENRSP